MTLPADLSLPAEVSRVAAFTTTTKVDVLVNNAGFGTYGTFAGLNAGHEHAEVMVNAVAGVDLAHAVLPGMLTRRSGGDHHSRLRHRLPAEPDAGDLRRDEGLQPGRQ
jgi:short-subunit dehydrogenase